MELTVNGEVLNAQIDDDLIDHSLAQLVGEGDSFLILAKDDMTYLQASGDPKHGFILEYQEGSLEHHYSCIEPSLGLPELSRAFRWYLHGDGRWKTDFRWEQQSLHGGTVGKGTALIVVLILAALIVWLW